MKGAGNSPAKSRERPDGATVDAQARLAAVAEQIKASQSSIVDAAQALVRVYLSEPDVAPKLADAKQTFENEKASGQKTRKHNLIWLEAFLKQDASEVNKAANRGAKTFELSIKYLAEAAVSLDGRSVECRSSQDELERLLRYGTPLPIKTSLSSPWHVVQLSELSPPEEGVHVLVRDFLQGRQRVPLWLAKSGSVWRGDVVQRIVARLDDCNFLILHGPAGHGKSMSAMQTLAAWLEHGRTVVVAHGEIALHDASLEAVCRASADVLILLDDVRITRALPSWLNLQGPRVAVVLQTIQTRKLDSQRIFLGEYARRLRIPVPEDATQFVDNLMEFGAAFTDKREEVANLFANGLGKGDYSGGLWAATWEATHGESIDDRIGAIVAEIFDDPSREGDKLCLSAVSFLNGIIEYSQRNPLHSRISLEPRRSTVSLLIDNHPAYSRASKDAALDSLSHIGAWLADELFNAGADPHILDLEDDPLIEFRSASVTHAFYRWLFGAFRGDGAFRVPRWPFYSALPAILVQRKAGPADFVGALRSLVDAWRVKPQHRTRYDHGRSQANLYELARQIYDACPHRAFAPKCRLDTALAKAALIASEGGATEERSKELTSDAKIRLLAATVDDAPWDVLLDSANAVMTYNLELPGNSESRKFDQLIERVIASKADYKAKQDAHYLRFKWRCLYQQGATFNQSWALLSRANLLRLGKDKRALNIIHGYLDIISNPINNATDAAWTFYESRDTSDIRSMVGVYRFSLFHFSRDLSLLKALSSAVGRDGGYVNNAGHPIVAGLKRVILATRKTTVPFKEVFDEGLVSLRDQMLLEIAREEYSNLPSWLMESAAMLKEQESHVDEAC